jgi:hypothetical protein
MDTLDNIRSSFLNKNGFKVGFSNRSPLNQYKSTMATSFDLPKLDTGKNGVGTRIAEGDNAISNAKIKGAFDIGNSISGAMSEIGTAIGKKQAAKKANEEKEKQEKEKEKEKQEKANIERSKIIHGLEDDSLAQQILAPHLVGVNEEARNEKKRNELTGQINKALNL